MNKKDEEKLNFILNKLKSLKYVYGIYLFGSQVNGRARKDSDIDIAVIIDNPTRKKELEVIGYGNDFFDISAFSRLPLNIQFRVIKEGKLLFCRDKGKLNLIKVEVLKRYLDFSSFMKGFYQKVISNV